MGVGELESVCLPKGIHVQMFHQHCAEQTKIFWGLDLGQESRVCSPGEKTGIIADGILGTSTGLRGLGAAASEEVREVRT